MTRRLGAFGLLVALLAGAVAPAGAARPLLDQHQWDAYFAMFAPDSNVPWKPATIRIDTYSGAPVDFAVYNVDPAQVIVAGQNRPARALDTARLRPLARWRFEPPPGYRFVSSDVGVPLGTQEGFYVVEARRGDAVQQVWMNRTHIGLVTEESPQGLVVWGVDLHSGRAIPRMHVDFLVGLRLLGRTTASDGTIVWTDPNRPVFALADDRAGRAFVSLLPSAPLPPTLVGVRLAESVVRAGGRIRAIGFARRLGPGGYRRGTGYAKIVVAGGRRSVGTATVRLDGAGAFDVDVPVADTVPSGTYAVLASAAGGVGGTSVQIDAASDVDLTAGAVCPCDPAAPVTVTLTAARRSALDPTPAAGLPVHLEVIRIPHVLPPGASEDAGLWGTTIVASGGLTTDALGVARYALQPPTDGLDSTYAIRATSPGASATTRIVVPQAAVALSLVPDAAAADPGAAIGFTARAFRIADGAPVPSLSVHVKLSHGSTVKETRFVLDASGSHRFSLPSAGLGSNLAVADVVTPDGRRALDAASVDVAPRALAGTSGAGDTDLTITTDRGRYGPADRVQVRASAPGAAGDALLAVAGARTYGLRVSGVSGGRASATLDLGGAQGDVRVRAAFVRDGAIATADRPIQVDGPGRARATDLVLDRTTYAPGGTLHATIRDGAATGGAPSTYVLRVSDGRAEGAAAFGDAAEVLSTGGTTAQAPASDTVSWHAWIAPSRSKASDLFGAERGRTVATELPTLGPATPRTVLWQVQRQTAPSVDLDVPRRRGRYVLSVLKMQPTGEVGAALASFDVE